VVKRFTMEIRKVRKQGNAWAICMPREYLKYLGVKLNEFVTIELREDSIVIKKMPKRLEVEKCR